MVEQTILKKIQRTSLDENAKKRYEVNVLDAVYFVTESWDKVSKTAIEKCFEKAEFPSIQVENDEDIADSEEVIHIYKIIAPEIDFNNYFTCGDSVTVYLCN